MRSYILLMMCLMGCSSPAVYVVDADPDGLNCGGPRTAASGEGAAGVRCCDAGGADFVGWKVEVTVNEASGNRGQYSLSSNKSYQYSAICVVR
jgi:hypothetical protein